MTGPRRLAALVAVNLVALLVLVEVVSVVAYYVRTGELFYAHSTRSRDRTLIAPEAAATAGGGAPATVQQLHPYFGFIDKVGTRHPASFLRASHPANNFGFASTHSYPFRKQHPAQFVVGVFGGSVAANYAFHEIETGLLAAALQRVPALAGRQVIVMPFAIGGYKQPQQLLVLSYFLSIGHDFDLVVNIDGFNEVALGVLNDEHGVESSMPSDFILLPMVNLATGAFSKDELALTLAILDDKERLARAAASLAAARTATGYQLAWLWSRPLAGRYWEGVRKLDQLRQARTGAAQTYMQIPARRPVSADEALAETVRQWSRSSLLMKQLLDQRRIPYVQFIQPNQYVPTRRVFGAGERSVAIHEGSAFRAGAVRGYPLLLAELVRLRGVGVNAFSAVEIFDDVGEPVYVDNCCHYNAKGSTVFGTYLARTIARVLAEGK